MFTDQIRRWANCKLEFHAIPIARVLSINVPATKAVGDVPFVTCIKSAILTFFWVFAVVKSFCKCSVIRVLNINISSIYTGVSWGECARLRENVPYVKVHRYNTKHLYPKLNGCEGKVWSSCGSTYCTCFACCYPSFSLTAESSTFRLHYQQTSQLQRIVIQYCWIFMCHVKRLEP